MLRKVRLALYNALNYYWDYPTHEFLLATILDFRNKKIVFATDSQRIEAKAYLVVKYKLFKESASTLHGIIQMKDDKKENALLANMYTSSIQDPKIIKEIQIYLMLPKIS
ncbi:565_t:CDS:1, partial [Cetraspora pellucida]